jgi:hypothetical protein
MVEPLTAVVRIRCRLVNCPNGKAPSCHPFVKNVERFPPHSGNYCEIAIEVGVFPTEYVPTGVSVPLLVFRLNDSIAGLVWFPTNRKWPVGSVAREMGCDPVANGEFVRGAKPPLEPIA